MIWYIYVKYEYYTFNSKSENRTGKGPKNTKKYNVMIAILIPVWKVLSPIRECLEKGLRSHQWRAEVSMSRRRFFERIVVPVSLPPKAHATVAEAPKGKAHSTPSPLRERQVTFTPLRIKGVARLERVDYIRQRVLKLVDQWSPPCVRGLDLWSSLPIESFDIVIFHYILLEYSFDIIYINFISSSFLHRIWDSCSEFLRPSLLTE